MKEYIQELKSPQPTPGGGSVAGILQQLCSALLQMTCSISYHACTTEDHLRSEVLAELIDKSEKILNKAAYLSQEDERVYQKVSNAFKISAADETEKENKKQAIALSCREAADVPYQIILLSSELLDLIVQCETSINKSLLSDLGVCLCVVEASAKAALYLVHANLLYMNPKEADRVYQKSHEAYDSFVKSAHDYQNHIDALLLDVAPKRKDL